MRIELGSASLYATGLMTDSTANGPSHLGVSLREDGPLSLMFLVFRSTMSPGLNERSDLLPSA